MHEVVVAVIRDLLQGDNAMGDLSYMLSHLLIVQGL